MESSSHTHRPINFRCCVTTRTPSDTGLTCSSPRTPLEFQAIVNTFPLPLHFPIRFSTLRHLTDNQAGIRHYLDVNKVGHTQDVHYSLLTWLYHGNFAEESMKSRQSKQKKCSEQDTHFHLWLFQQDCKVRLPIYKKNFRIYACININF